MHYIKLHIILTKDLDMIIIPLMEIFSLHDNIYLDSQTQDQKELLNYFFASSMYYKTLHIKVIKSMSYR